MQISETHSSVRRSLKILIHTFSYSGLDPSVFWVQKALHCLVQRRRATLVDMKHIKKVEEDCKECAEEDRTEDGLVGGVELAGTVISVVEEDTLASSVGDGVDEGVGDGVSVM